MARLKLFLFSLGALGVFLGAGLTLFVYHHYQKLPSRQKITEALKAESLELSSQIFDQSKEHIGEFSVYRRYHLSINKIPKHLTDAFISIEDSSFYTHKGLDIFAIFRAALANLRQQKLAQGASTITQQVARMYFLNRDKDFSRKFKEILLAIKIETVLDKSEILEVYLNRIYLGKHAYGVQAASLTYFSKSVEDLTVGEAALLAALPKAPSRLALHRNFNEALERQRYVLLQMHELGHIDFNTFSRELGRSPQLRLMDSFSSKEAGYFVEVLESELIKKFEFQDLAEKGMRVHSTFSTAIHNKLREKILSRLKRVITPELQLAWIVVDLSNGNIKSLQGGDGFLNTQFNRVTNTYRPIGDLAHTIVLAHALESGVSLAQPIMQPEVRNPIFKKMIPTLLQSYIDANSDDLALIVAELGARNVAATSRTLGFPGRVDDLRMVLGREKVSLMQVSKVFSTILSGGKSLRYRSLLRLEDLKEKVVYKQSSADASSVLSASSAFLTRFALREKYSQGEREDITAQISVSRNCQDAWLIVTRGRHLFSMWLGAERGRRRLAKSVGAAKTFLRNLLKEIYFALPEDDWDFRVRQKVAYKKIRDYDVAIPFVLKTNSF